MKLLCTGDIHIGRRATRLPASTEMGRFSAGQAWLDVVDLAIAENVDVVVLTGDIVDRANRYYEAYGQLEQGIGRLASHQIVVVAVAGNHDFDVLPKLARSFAAEQFRLLGEGGRWERYLVAKEGTPGLYFDGWSFPTEHVTTNPLNEYDLSAPTDGRAVVGVLHADLDQSTSQYAPVRQADLRSRPPDLWLLGHIHLPQWMTAQGESGLLYPGSPLSLSPKETGPHGPWLIQFDSGNAPYVKQMIRSPVRYEELAVDLTGLTTLADIDIRIADSLRQQLAANLAVQGESLRHLITRLRLIGRTTLHRQLADHLAVGLTDLEVPNGHALATVDAWKVETRPDWDLEQVALMPGPPGVLAQMLLELYAEKDPRANELTVAMQRQLRHIAVGRDYLPLVGHGDEHLADVAQTDEELLDTVQQQGLLLLDALLAQQEVVR